MHEKSRDISAGSSLETVELRAWQLVRPKEFRLLEVSRPPATENQVEVELLRATVCGSDLHMYRGRRPHPPFPLSPGRPAHECLGRALADDPEGRFDEGDILLVRPPESDGLREMLAVPSENVYPVKPYGLEKDPDRAVLGSLVAPVLKCARLLGNIVGKSVLVIGQGPSGLIHTEIARRMGADFIVTADLLRYRLEESKRRGADAVVDASSEDVVSAAENLTNGKLFDVVIEAVGSPETIAEAPMLARPEGVVVFYGLPGEDSLLRPYRYFSKRLVMRSSEFPQREDFELALKMIGERMIDVRSMITHILEFEDVPRAYRLADEKKENVIRVVVRTA